MVLVRFDDVDVVFDVEEVFEEVFEVLLDFFVIELV